MEENEKKVTVGGIISKFIVALGAFLIVLLIYFLIDANPPDGAADILVNDALYTATDASVWYQKTYDEPYYNEGSRYAVSGVRYIKPVNQWQITVQANISVFKAFAEKKGLSVAPDDFTDFRFVLYDDNGREYTEYDFADFAKTRHRYRRLIFDSVNGKNVSELSLDIYYKDETEPTVSLPVYDSSIPLEPSKDKIPSDIYAELKHIG